MFISEHATLGNDQCNKLQENLPSATADLLCEQPFPYALSLYVNFQHARFSFG